METLISILLVFMAIALVAMMLFQAFRGTVDLISVRNFFLVGFILFQLVSGVLALTIDNRGDFAVQEPGRTGLVYFIYVIVFLSLLLLAYHGGWVVNRIASHPGKWSVAPGVGSLITLSVSFLVVGMAMRLVLVYIPVLGILSGMAAIGFLAVAAGAIAWVWAPRALNPVLAGLAVAVLLVVAATVLHKTFGRRDILSVLMCFMWGAYHSHWKWLGPGRAMVRFGALAAAGAILLAGLTAVRSGADRDRSGVEMVTRLAEADFKTGLVQIASGQQAALNSMWIIENYPEQFEYNTLSTLVYIAVNPIPRVLWEGKPIALGRLAVFQARADRQRLSNYTIGPGIIGHIVSDNPWLAMVPYALGLGLFLRLLDELVRNRPHNIFVVLPIGVAIGQFIGLSRGDSGLFFFYASVTMIAAWISMWVVVRVLQAFGWNIEMEDEHAGDWPAGEPPEYGDKGPSGQSESAG